MGEANKENKFLVAGPFVVNRVSAPHWAAALASTRVARKNEVAHVGRCIGKTFVQAVHTVLVCWMAELLTLSV